MTAFQIIEKAYNKKINSMFLLDSRHFLFTVENIQEHFPPGKKYILN